MKALIITVAGTSSRFNRDLDHKTLKCIYHTGDPTRTLLYQIIEKADGADRIVLVGGYMYDELEKYVSFLPDDMKERIELVYNTQFEKYGSGYSLYLGIKQLPETTKETIFVEGDLYFDKISFDKVIDSVFDVLTVNREFITADKAVVLYTDVSGRVHYLYDTTHNSLVFSEPVSAVYNSAQIWKFRDVVLLKRAVEELSAEQLRGTNLEIIQWYFSRISADRRAILPVETWINCNTVADYEKWNSLIETE